jgi:hypothetical protein
LGQRNLVLLLIRGKIHNFLRNKFGDLHKEAVEFFITKLREARNIQLEFKLSIFSKAEYNQQTNACVETAVPSTFRLPISNKESGKHTTAKIWPKKYFKISGSWFRASAMTTINKKPARCTLVLKSLKFYCILILLYIFRALLRPSSGAS